jgi:3-methylcrotonyl-CoA carboxylase beta subunit
MWAKRLTKHVKLITPAIDNLYIRYSNPRTAYNLTTNAANSRPFPVIRVNNETASPDGALKGDNAESSRSEALELSRLAEEVHCKLEDVCKNGGGERGAKRHVELNRKVLVRERVSGILDPGTELTEIGLTAGMGLEYGDVPCGGTVAGIGQVSGIPVMFLCNDATVKGGTSYPITVTKSLRIQEIAAQNRLPCLYLVDSGGAFLPLQSEIFPDAKHGGRSFANQARMSGQGIPQVSIVAGLSTAGGAYTPTMAEEHIMVHKVGQVYLAGPPLIKAALGEDVSGEELGGATLHCEVSGVADHFASTEKESFVIVRDVIASLNEGLGKEGSRMENIEEPLFPCEELDYYASKTGEPILQLDRESILGVLASLLDGSRFQEFKGRYGDKLICGFGFLKGRLCGIVSNCSGASTPGAQQGLQLKDAQKGSHFVQLCNARDIPMIFLQNSGNNSASIQNVDADECDSISLKERGKLARCVAIARVPKITVNITGATGDDHFTLCGPSFGSSFYFSWPRAIVRKYDPILNNVEPPLPKVC